MNGVSRVSISVATAFALLMGLAGCSLPSGTTLESSAARENEQALDRYVELERATIPDWLAQYPGLYEEIKISGVIKLLPDERFTYSVAIFQYKYANAMDHVATAASLDQAKPLIDEICTTTIFPAMRNVGVTGPLAVQYSYRDASGQIWLYACTDS